MGRGIQERGQGKACGVSSLPRRPQTGFHCQQMKPAREIGGKSMWSRRLRMAASMIGQSVGDLPAEHSQPTNNLTDWRV